MYTGGHPYTYVCTGAQHSQRTQLCRPGAGRPAPRLSQRAGELPKARTFLSWRLCVIMCGTTASLLHTCLRRRTPSPTKPGSKTTCVARKPSCKLLLHRRLANDDVFNLPKWKKKPRIKWLKTGLQPFKTKNELKNTANEVNFEKCCIFFNLKLPKEQKTTSTLKKILLRLFR